MNIRLLFILFLASPWGTIINAQKILTLQECYRMAYETAPLLTEKEAYGNIWRLNDQNLTRGWLPTIDANGSFSYNSSVVDMTDVIGSLPIPGINDLIKPVPNEQYRITLDINQVIYDGGSIKSARALEKANLNVNSKQTDIDLYKLREQVNRYYFNLLLLKKQEEMLTSYLEVIVKRINSLTSAVESGVILKSDIDILTSEKIKLEQELTENGIKTSSLLKILSDLTGTDIGSSTELVIPSAENEAGNELTRPELLLLDLRKEQLDASLLMIQSKRMPKAFGFATFGYGNPPGSNFFKDEFAPFYMLGAGVKWNLFDWNRSKDEKQIVSLQKSMTESRKKDLTDNLKRLLDAKDAEIASLQSLMETDTQLIVIRKRITRTAESQYENGAITATEYLIELNGEKQAVINHEIHKINLALARVEYMNISGQEIN